MLQRNIIKICWMNWYVTLKKIMANDTDCHKQAENNRLYTKFKCNYIAATDGNDIALGSTRFFVNIGASFVKIITVSDDKPSDYRSHNVMEMFHLSPLTEAEVDKIISNFKDSAEGWDELKPAIIKTVKNSINFLCTHWQYFMILEYFLSNYNFQNYAYSQLWRGVYFYQL